MIDNVKIFWKMNDNDKIWKSNDGQKETENVIFFHSHKPHNY